MSSHSVAATHTFQPSMLKPQTDKVHVVANLQGGTAAIPSLLLKEGINSVAGGREAFFSCPESTSGCSSYDLVAGKRNSCLRIHLTCPKHCSRTCASDRKPPTRVTDRRRGHSRTQILVLNRAQRGGLTGSCKSPRCGTSIAIAYRADKQGR
jgi:hypothetical protein